MQGQVDATQREIIIRNVFQRIRSHHLPKFMQIFIQLSQNYSSELIASSWKNAVYLLNTHQYSPGRVAELIGVALNQIQFP